MPTSTDLRCYLRRWEQGGLAFLFNEGKTNYAGRVTIALSGQPSILEPGEGTLTRIVDAMREADKWSIPIQIGAGESLVLLFGDSLGLQEPMRITEGLELNGNWEAVPLHQHRVGQHNYEITKTSEAATKPIELGNWDAFVGQDFSGVVAYRRRVKVPEGWVGQDVRLSLGDVNYAARIRIDDRDVGTILWSPMSIDVTLPESRTEFVLTVEVANTLANELTSERVQKEWAQRTGPGWPGPYHQRAFEFEKDSRKGGLFGPIRIELLSK